MIGFIWKGLLRDKSRSLFPFLIILGGVLITVVLYSWMQGSKEMIIYENARFDTGHVKVVTRAYAEDIDQKPYDLCLLELEGILSELQEKFPRINWVPRIYFGGLLDKPDSLGETMSQGQIMAMGIDLLNSNIEKQVLNLELALVEGRLIRKKGEIIISKDIAEKMGIGIGSEVTVISSTMYGSMSMQNFFVAGTIRFGVTAMDRGTTIMDISDAQFLLDMNDGASEILGFLPGYVYNEAATLKIAEEFNTLSATPEDEFSPVMLPLRHQAYLAFLLDALDSRVGLMILVFMIIMGLVLWNSGLMNGIRRYGEIGIRLAIGESKTRVYLTMILEAIILGFCASLAGTILGVGISFLLQEVGIDISSMLKNVTVMMSTVWRARVNATSFFIGFIPGVLASVAGSLVAGIGIYRRQTAQLFKELEL